MLFLGNVGQSKRRQYAIAVLLVTSVFTSGCSTEYINTPQINNEQQIGNANPPPLSNKSGGSFTIANRGRQALQRPQPNLSGEQQLEWAVGKSFASQAWVTAPATTTSRDGLGPLFNANSCIGCHVRNGQGQMPEKGLGLILRLSDNSALSSGYGEQLQDMATPGNNPEGTINWSSSNTNINLANGHRYDVNQRRYKITTNNSDNERSTKDHSDVHVSARLAPALIGMGLLDNISEKDILTNSDPDDIDGDGISGRANFRETAPSTRHLGRFGWKASQTSLYEQVALAFSQDMGITSSIHPFEVCTNCNANAGNNVEQEISDKLLLAVTNYIANLAVPEANHDALSQQGLAVFNQLGCAACHTPAFTIHLAKTSINNVNVIKPSALVHSTPETIYPYSDLLLHDMGNALADARSSDHTPANEWRTAPLWGLGIRSENPDTTRLLHDGRARTITEAILWHGGEANASKASFSQLSEPELSVLLHFLKAL
ncbi:di-heme oxidoredictase family protein [Zhongshania sp. BJYM1]|uniref:di-heme oxidoredictase family protein n=1 Tax=Zhongshania aquatica TaxID=2965069 RepID=UPI0022B378ED|nr:di-heme oxidoredictase family protein [Marortus sp. BJYM1]